MKNLHRSLIIGCSALALAGCGADEIVSPGTGGNVTINNPAPPPPPPPPPPPTNTLVTPAADCPQIANPVQLLNLGTITGPTGEYRRCRVPAQITASSTLPYDAGVLYELNGQTDVGVDEGFASTGTTVTLDIEPGVIVFASGNDFLNVNRGNQLIANGTSTNPIIFTSRQNVEGSNNNDSSGQWGGIILSGRAPVADGCFLGSEAAGTCQRRVEGATNQILYGGTNSADSSGSLSFVQIRYSGFALSNGDELQSLTTGGIGSGTTLQNIMTYNSSDDGAEFFGGSVNARRFIMVGAEDDSLDTDNGVKGQFDELLIVQRGSASDTLLEQDSGSSSNAPRTNVQINNATMVSDSSAGQFGLNVRGGSDFSLFNSVIWDFGNDLGGTFTSGGTTYQSGCIEVRGDALNRAAGAADDEAGPAVFNSVALDCATNFSSFGNTQAAVEARFDAGTGNDKAFSNTLQRLSGVTTGAPFINGANENGFTPIFAFAASSFFSDRGYIGAITSEASNWAEGWTCNSSVVVLGTNNSGNCDTLPTP